MTPHRARLIAGLTALLCGWAASPALAAAPPLVSTSPGLFPAFRTAVLDYAVRCEPSRRIAVSVVAPAGTTVAVDGRAARGGTYDVPVRLLAGRRFALTVTTASRTTTHHVRCLPAEFPQWEARRFGATQGAYHLLSPDDLAVVFDALGVPIWWWRQRAPAIGILDFKLLPSGDLAWGDVFERGSYATDPRSRYSQRRLDGSLVRVSKVAGAPTDFHDLIELPNGNHLMLAYPMRDHVDLSPFGGPSDATVADGMVQERSQSGEVVWSWNSKDHVSPAETDRWLPWRRTPPFVPPNGVYDLIHLNSVEPTADGNVLISARNLDAILKVRRATGEIIWKLGGTRTEDSLALPAGATPIGAQHDARELADGTIALHDNGSGMDRPPRAARFRIDETAKTATLVEELYDPQVARSACCGSARRLPGGNWVMSWGGSSLITELTPAGERVLELKLLEPGLRSYRDAVVPAGVVPRSHFRAGMDAQYPRVPLVVALPRISGTAQVGEVLTATHGEWSPADNDYDLAWQRCDSAGANCSRIGDGDAMDGGSSYTLTEADRGSRIRVVVTATNDDGSRVQRSSASRTVGVPERLATPRISGTARLGETLRTSSGAWEPAADAYVYRWLRCDLNAADCAQIDAADAVDGDAEYRLTATDRGRRIRSSVTAINAAGSSRPARSAATSAVP